MCLFFMKNEDNLYPPEKGFKGIKLFKEYMYEVLEDDNSQDKKYEIKKNKLTKITEKVKFMSNQRPGKFKTATLRDGSGSRQ